MKPKFLLFAFTLGISTAFAQKAKVQTAYNYFKYEQLDKAKEAIDEAAINEGSMNMDKTWYYRGLIYEDIYTSDKYKSLSDNALEVAYNSYKKALELDPKSDFKEEISTRMNYVKNAFFNKAVEDFKAKNYTSSLTGFEYVLKISPDDTSATLYAAYSADRAKNYTKAIMYYQKVIDSKHDDAATYKSLINIYKAQNDTVHSLSALEEGRKKYPDDLDMMLTEINIHLKQGNSKDATDLLNKAITKDPKNASLYFALGATYDNMANPKNGALVNADDKKLYTDKAKENYTKAIENKPDYFEANYNLGTMYFNQAAEMLGKISSIKDAKEYAAAKQDVEAQFALAQPYLERALELSPKDHDTLVALKQLYFRKNDMDKYYRVKDKLDQEGK